jgi:predicted  nucleic acid-binding Zn-ribbon protein
MMEITSVVALILGCLSILGTVISTVWFFGRLRWEVDSLKRENEQQDHDLKEIMEAIKSLREKGGAPIELLEKRITKLEEKFDVFSGNITKAINDLIVEVRTKGRAASDRRQKSE